MDLLILAVVAFFAFFLKGMTGFGPAMVIISLGALFFPPHQIIAAGAVLDCIAGAVLLKNAGMKDNPGFLSGILLSMAAGVVLGAISLRYISPTFFTLLLGLAIFVVSLWLIIFRGRPSSSPLLAALPNEPSRSDLIYSCIAGFSGGLIGIDGPPIVWHFGRHYNKEVFRSLLVTVFLVAALVRVGSYSIMGLVTESVITLVAVSIPGLLLGLYFGSKAFIKISERNFSMVMGVVLLVISCRILVG